MGIVNESIEDAIGDGGVTDHFMPDGDGVLRLHIRPGSVIAP